LAGGADEHAEDGGTAYGCDFGSRRELGLKYVRNKGTEHGEIDDIEEISRGDERDNSPMKRRYFRLIQSAANECLDCLGHVVLPTVSARQPFVTALDAITVAGRTPGVKLEGAVGKAA
jgi:hypothetical protein